MRFILNFSVSGDFFSAEIIISPLRALANTTEQLYAFVSDNAWAQRFSLKYCRSPSIESIMSSPWTGCVVLISP